MPKIDFSTVEDAEDFTPIPEGKYLCKVAEVEEVSTHGGDEMWKLTLEVIEGEFKGKKIFDNLVFTDNAMKRVKLVCSRMGLDVSGELNLTPEMIGGVPVWVDTTIEEYEAKNGDMKKRNSVPFAGYESADGATVESDSGSTNDSDDTSEKELPF